MFNKSEIMKRAWELNRMFKGKVPFNKALKMAWDSAKSAIISEASKESFFVNVDFAVLEKNGLNIFVSPSNWWKECESRNIDEYTKKRGYAILKKAEYYRDERSAKKAAYGF